MRGRLLDTSSVQMCPSPLTPRYPRFTLHLIAGAGHCAHCWRAAALGCGNPAAGRQVRHVQLFSVRHSTSGSLHLACAPARWSRLMLWVYEKISQWCCYVVQCADHSCIASAHSCVQHCEANCRRCQCRAGIGTEDSALASWLRRTVDTPVLLAANKCERRGTGVSGALSVWSCVHVSCASHATSTMPVQGQGLLVAVLCSSSYTQSGSKQLDPGRHDTNKLLVYLQT